MLPSTLTNRKISFHITAFSLAPNALPLNELIIVLFSIMTTHCADGTSATGTATSAYGFFEPVKKNYFAKQPIEAPLKFSTGVNSSSGSLVLHRKDSSRLLRQPTLMASASAKNIETLPQNETKPLTFRSYLQKGTDPQPPLTKLSSFARQVEESRPAPN